MAHEIFDIGVLTVIPEELEAVRQALHLSRRPKLQGRVCYSGTTRSELQRRDYSIVLTCVGAAGNPPAAAAAMELIERHKPQVLILVGIAAGIRSKVKIGNVILSERVVAYEPAALIRQKDNVPRVEPRPNIDRLPYAMVQDIMNYIPDSDRITERFFELNNKLPAPTKGKERQFRKLVADTIVARPSTIASGEKLLRDPEKLLVIRRDMHGQIEAGEMEAAGFVEACHQRAVNWLVIRGISDFGDRFKDDQFHTFGAQAAAAVLADFLVHGLDIPEPQVIDIDVSLPSLGQLPGASHELVRKLLANAKPMNAWLEGFDIGTLIPTAGPGDEVFFGPGTTIFYLFNHLRQKYRETVEQFRISTTNDLIIRLLERNSDPILKQIQRIGDKHLKEYYCYYCANGRPDIERVKIALLGIAGMGIERDKFDLRTCWQEQVDTLRNVIFRTSDNVVFLFSRDKLSSSAGNVLLSGQEMLNDCDTNLSKSYTFLADDGGDSCTDKILILNKIMGQSKFERGSNIWRCCAPNRAGKK